MKKKKKISEVLKGLSLYEPVNINTFTADTQRLYSTRELLMGVSWHQASAMYTD